MKLIIAAPAEVYRWEAEEEDAYDEIEGIEEEYEDDDYAQSEAFDEVDVYDDDDMDYEEDIDEEGDLEEEDLVTEAEELRTLSGVEYQTELFSDYFLEDPDAMILRGKNITGGILGFELDEDEQTLWGFTEYNVERELDDAELQAIIDFTLGQWSDGIGESFAQEYAEETGYYVQLVPPDDEVTYYYEEDEEPAA